MIAKYSTQDVTHEPDTKLPDNIKSEECETMNIHHLKDS